MGFVGGRGRFDQQFPAVAVNGKILELGLGFKGFGVVDVQFGTAADGAEYVDGYEYVGVGVFGRHDFDAAQVEDGLDEVGQEGNVAGVGNQGFVAVVARAVDGQSGRPFAFAPAVFSQSGGGRVQKRCGSGNAGERISFGSGSSIVGGIAVLGGAVGVVLVAAANQCIDGVASAGNVTRTLVAHSGDVKGDFAAFQGRQIHFFDGGTGRGGDEFLFDGKAFAAAV